MAERKPQIKLDVTPDIHRRILSEKLKRNLTMQRMMLRALERYWAIPESSHCLADEADPKPKPDPVDEDIEAVRCYLRQLPAAKVSLVRQMLETDLPYYLSARKRQRPGGGGFE